MSTNQFEIKELYPVVCWKWNVSSDTCAICRNSLNEPSIEYQVSPFKFKLYIVSNK